MFINLLKNAKFTYEMFVFFKLNEFLVRSVCLRRLIGNSDLNWERERERERDIEKKKTNFIYISVSFVYQKEKKGNVV